MSNYVNLLDIIYPVGSIYITFSETSPSNIIGGTWQSIEKRFLYNVPDESTGTLNGTYSHQHRYGWRIDSYYGGLVNVSPENDLGLMQIFNYTSDVAYNKKFGSAHGSSITLPVNAGIQSGWKQVQGTDIDYEAETGLVQVIPAYICVRMYRRTA